MLWFPRFLAFASGFISLSLEILWVRYAAFAYRGAPQAFSFVLGMYVYAFSNLVIASDRDLTGDLAHAAERLAAIRFDGRQVIDAEKPEFAEKIQRMVGNVRRFDESVDPTGQPLEVITDQNMLSEYRYGRTVFGHSASAAP